MMEPLPPQGFAEALARQSLAAFANRASPIINGESLLMNWHIEAICYKLEQVARGEVKRLLLCMPPRCLKSYLATVCFSAWVLGHDPDKKIICASYAAPLAEKLSMDTRTLMQSPWYKSVFKTRLHPQKMGREEFATARTGYRMATSVGGTLTGRGADIIIIDDPLKASDTYSEAARASCIEWYKTTVQSRLNNPKTGAIIVVAQRLHEQDLPGHLLEAGDWDTLILPMEAPRDFTVELLRDGKVGKAEKGRLLQPERHGPEELARIRREMGERDYEAQYNQAPQPAGGALFQRSWVSRYDAPLQLGLYEGIYQSWDTAYEIEDNNDYSVCTTWGIIRDEFHLLDVYRKRLAFPELRHAVLMLREKFQPQMVIVEAIGSGLSLYQDIRRYEQAPWLNKLRPAHSKVHRASQQTIKFEKGKVFLPKKADWLEEFEKELFSFPNGKYDDQVDSAVQFLAAVDTGNLMGSSRAMIRVR